MSDKEVERIEKIINEAVENAWEEAKLRDLMNLYLMWEQDLLSKYTSFNEFLDIFFDIDDRIRAMKEVDYCKLEGAVVEAICNNPKGIHSSLCKQKECD